MPFFGPPRSSTESRMAGQEVEIATECSMERPSRSNGSEQAELPQGRGLSSATGTMRRFGQSSSPFSVVTRPIRNCTNLSQRRIGLEPRSFTSFLLNVLTLRKPNERQRRPRGRTWPPGSRGQTSLDRREANFRWGRGAAPANQRRTEPGSRDRSGWLNRDPRSTTERRSGLPQWVKDPVPYLMAVVWSATVVQRPLRLT